MKYSRFIVYAVSWKGYGVFLISPGGSSTQQDLYTNLNLKHLISQP